MQYQGGKERVARSLTEFMLSARGDQGVYVEPFMGGCSILSRMASHFTASFGGDIDQSLVSMWEAVVHSNWVPPEPVSREEYQELRRRDDPINPATAFAAYGVSFGGERWGGYASCKRGDDYAGAARRGVMRKARTMGSVTFGHGSYETYNEIVGDGVLVYCDPPYANTTGYATGDFESAPFWSTMERWSKSGALVFVSEYTAPDGWVPVWTRDKTVTLEKGDNSSRSVTEHLFRFDTSSMTETTPEDQEK